MKVLMAVYPQVGFENPENVLVAIGGEDGVDSVTIIFSKVQGIELIRHLTTADDRVNLLSKIDGCALPASAVRPSVVLSPFTAARIHNAHTCYEADKKPDGAIVYEGVYPSIVYFEATTSAQVREFNARVPHPDFMGCGFDSTGEPEIVIGFSQDQATTYLDGRRLWHGAREQIARWDASVRASALPMDSDLASYRIAGPAAAGLLPLFAHVHSSTRRSA